MRQDISQDGDAWHEFRAGGIGSSDIAAIMGKSPYKTAADVYYEKCGLSEQFQTAAMKRGKEKEAEALALCNILFVNRIESFTACCWIHDDFSFCRASLDGYSNGELIEIKIPSSKKSKEEAINEILPEQYLYQIQWQLFVTGAEIGWYFVYDDIMKKEIFYDRIEKDKLLHHEMFLAATKFWQDFEAGICPEVEEKCIEIDEPLLKELVAKYKELSKLKAPLDDEISFIEKQMKGVRSNILDFGDDGSFMCDGLKATCVMGKPTYDIERMQRDGIDVKKYIKKQANYFRITLDKD